MKYKSEANLMGLPQYIKFGCEIEVQNVDVEKLKKAMLEFPELNGWKITKDNSVTDNGAEIVSPPLSEVENQNVYAEFQKVLSLIKSCPADKNRNVYVNEQCGGHIHFDATMMRKNPEMVESYLRLWAEAEELIFKMCNAENNPIRESAVKLTPVDGLKRFFFSGVSEIFKAIDITQKDGSDIGLNLINGVKKGTEKSIKRFSYCSFNVP
ncbi:MAG: amidoligase family protein [Clostridia bacterium]|nr:amidoligase family protein [Clostridia bacterium]